MSMNGKLSLKQLFDGYLNNRLTKEQTDEFLSCLHDPKKEARIAGMIDDTWIEMFESRQVKPRIVRLWTNRFLRMVVAVVLVITVGTTYFQWMHRKEATVAVA